MKHFFLFYLPKQSKNKNDTLPIKNSTLQTKIKQNCVSSQRIFFYISLFFPFLLSLSFFSFYVPFSVLAQVGRFFHNLSPPPISVLRQTSILTASFMSSSKTPLHLFLGLPFPSKSSMSKQNQFLTLASVLQCHSSLRISSTLIGHVSLPYTITLCTHVLLNVPFVSVKRPLLSISVQVY